MTKSIFSCLGCLEASHSLKKQWKQIQPQAFLKNGDSWFSYLTSFPSKPQKGHTECPGSKLAYLLAHILAVRRYRGQPGLQADALPSDVKHWGIRAYRGKVWEQLRSEEFPITLSKQELEFLNCSSYFTAEARGYKSKKARHEQPSTIILTHITVNDESRSVQGQWGLRGNSWSAGYYQRYSSTVTLLSADGQEHDVGFLPPLPTSRQTWMSQLPKADRHLASAKFHKEQR